MSLEVIYVTRHGFRSPWSVDPSTGNYTASIRSPTKLPTDPALASHGVEQANELATHLLDVNPPIDQVYSSPYFRCMQTIQPFVRSLRRIQTQSFGNVSVKSPPGIRVELGLSEWYGLAPFEHPSSAPLDELQSFFPEIDVDYASSPAPSRHGESLPQLHDRVAQVVDYIIRHSNQEGHKAVLVCTHAAVVIALGRVLTGQMERDFGAFTCGLSKFKRQASNSVHVHIDPGDKAGTKVTVPVPRDERKIRETRSQALPQIDHAGDADPHPHDPRCPDSGSPRMDEIGLYGGWTCELDSDCSFLSGGEERGWKFSGDESFLGTDGNGLWLSNEGSNPNTGVDRSRIESHGSHINPVANPVAGTSKL
ncbi:phosphoglycerate mutase-like protein [Hypoxylon sp. EC38]|nr:phosphoglycerate mutase-like protein [Hypoxylon sp. EC38]